MSQSTADGTAVANPDASTNLDDLDALLAEADALTKASVPDLKRTARTFSDPQAEPPPPTPTTGENAEPIIERTTRRPRKAPSDEPKAAPEPPPPVPAEPTDESEPSPTTETETAAETPDVVATAEPEPEPPADADAPLEKGNLDEQLASEDEYSKELEDTALPTPDAEAPTESASPQAEPQACGEPSTPAGTSRLAAMAALAPAWLSFLFLAPLRMLVLFLSALDKPFAWIPFDIKKALGYVALITLVMALGVFLVSLTVV
jgi:hypothetical protein